MHDATPTTRRNRLSLRNVAATVLLASTLAGVAGAAEVPPFEMLAIVDAPGGVNILHRNYPAAIDRADDESGARSEAALWRQTNLCVAYTMSAQPAPAAAACDAAVELTGELNTVRWSKEAAARQAARAHVNRGISLLVAGNRDAAELDFAAARKLAPSADFVRKNLAALDARRERLAANR